MKYSIFSACNDKTATVLPDHSSKWYRTEPIEVEWMKKIFCSMQLILEKVL